MKHKILNACLAVVFTVAGVFATAQAAQADTSVGIAALASPHDYGHVNTLLIWSSKTFWQLSSGGSYTGKLYDTAADGHGPYLHVFSHGKTGNFLRQPDGCAVHETRGEGYGSDVTGCWDGYGADEIAYVDMYVCNGGDSYGNSAVEGGCYGRRYYNQITSPGKGSISLGTTYWPL